MRLNKRIRFGLLGLVIVLISAPTVVWASHQFVDVPDSNIFHGDISWLADAGVTLGCNPPANDQYCPKDNVTREQMAAFLRRLSENQVVDADKVDGKDASQLETAAYSAWNNGPIASTSLDREIITLDVPAGSYVFIATAWVENPSGVEVTAECTLSAGVDFDKARVGLALNSSLQDTAAVTMTTVHTFTSADTATLTCTELAFNADLNVSDAKITAISVDSLTNTHAA
ncbi:MAG: S-layer homology domain-containing protein [Acidimicrobiia bacterium]